jgi:hypothetical protein
MYTGTNNSGVRQYSELYLITRIWVVDFQQELEPNENHSLLGDRIGLCAPVVASLFNGPVAGNKVPAQTAPVFLQGSQAW